MRVMTKEELEIVLKNHLHRLHKDAEGWEDMRAKLSYADLSYVNLSYADLSYVNLSYADLSGTNLFYANLSGANLSGAILSYANLSYANLSYANLSGANLSGANLSGANLSYADLSGVNLSGVNLSGANLFYANLSGANLSGVNLSGANLSGANLSYAILSYAKGDLIEYRTGKVLTDDIIGFKKCKNNVIVKLLIPRGAIVFSINGNRCRTNKAKVLEIEGADRAISNYNYMSYYVGDEFTVYNFDCIYNKECGAGIHFFMTKEEAVGY